MNVDETILVIIDQFDSGNTKLLSAGNCLNCGREMVLVEGYCATCFEKVNEFGDDA